jgi:hypothetical protein
MFTSFYFWNNFNEWRYKNSIWILSLEVSLLSLSNSMEKKSPLWGADSHSTSQEIPGLSWGPKVDYRVHNRPPLVQILSEMYSVHNFPTYFLKIHSNIILPFTTRSSEWSPRFSTKTVCTWPAHIILLDLIILKILGEAYKLQSSSMRSPLQPPANRST